MTRHLTRTLIIGIAAATSAVACTLTQRDQADSPVRPRALIYFENRSIDQTAVYVVREGIDEVRIGTVLAGRTDTLIVPPDMAIGNSIRIIARPLAGSFVRSS